VPNAQTVDLVTAMGELAPKTQHTYQRWIQRFFASTYRVDIHRVDLSTLRLRTITVALDPQHVKPWLEGLKASGLGYASLVQARCAVIWLAQHIADCGAANYELPGSLSRLPLPDGTGHTRSKRWLTSEEVRRLLDALGLEERPARRARNTAIIVLMVTCGLRREEVVAAKWKDITRRDGHEFLLVHGKGSKERTVVLPSITREAIAAWRPFHPMPHGEHFIFTVIHVDESVTTQGVSGQTILAVVQQAGLLADLDISPHDLRRTFARGAYEAGADYEAIRSTLGHESAGTTQHYIGADPEPQTSAPEVWADGLTS